MEKRMVALGLLVLLAAGAIYVGRESQRRDQVSRRIKEAYELANPGSTVTRVTLMPENGVYRAVFRLDDQLVEVHVDKGGNYVFPISTDLQSTLDSLGSQRDFFRCLREKGVILYGRSGTNVTQKQLQELEGSIYVDEIYYDCSDEQLDVCLARNVTSVPAWFIEGTLYEGLATMADIERLTGCSYAGQ